MRYLFLVALALTLVPTASAAHPPKPCVLLTNAQVDTVLGSSVAERSLSGNGKFYTCTWLGPPEGSFDSHPSVMLTTRFLSKAEFVHEAQTMSGSEVSGVGSVAFVALSGATLQTWQGGLVLEFDYNKVTGSLAGKEKLAKLAVAHL